jgi:diguanylate cyclase (GGDEF)-like protein
MRLFFHRLAHQWFRFTTPAGISPTTVYERERLRKAHLLSMAMFPLLLATGIGLLVTAYIGELTGTLIDCCMLLLLSGVARLNRQGRLYLAGLLFICGYMIACAWGLQLANANASISITYDWVFWAMVPLLAGYVLPWRAPFLLSLFAIGIMVLIYENGFLHQSIPYFTNSFDQMTLILIAAFVLLSIAALTAIYARSVEKAVVEADRAVELEQMHHDLTAAYARLEDLATHDPITGLLNHRALHHVMLELMASERSYLQPVSVIFADLDHFKQVNDTWGHQIGDSVLRHAAEQLRALVRAEDTVGRYGGEEFIIVLPGLQEAEAVHMAERLRAVIAQSPFNLPDSRQVAITLSLGVATFPDDGRTLEAIIAAADNAMYQAKHNGRNCVCRVPQAPQTNAA